MNSWWVLVAVGLFAGTVAAHTFQEGKTFEYEYRSVVLNGIPELDQQYAVFGLQSTVQIHSLNSRKLLMEMKNIQVAHENKRFEELSPEEIQLQMSSSGAYQNLTKPFIVEFQSDGTVKEINFFPSDPEWSRQMKTGLATMLQLKKFNSAVESNQLNRGDKSKDIGTVTQQMEPTPSGICNSIYSYYLKSEGSDQQPQEMTVNKIRDSHECIQKPYLATSTLRRFECNDCQKDDSHPLHQNDVCKYNVTLTTSKDYIIQQAICDGIVKIKPLGANADALTVIHNRTLELKRTKPIEDKARASLTNFNWETEKPYSNLTDKLVNIRNPKSLNEPIFFQEICGDCDSLKDQTRRLLHQYIEQVKNQHTSVDESREILDLITPIQLGFMTLHYDELSDMAREYSNDKTSKKIFFDFVAITASNPCIKLIMESHRNKVLAPEETTELLPKVAAHVLNPNTHLCDKLLEFCMSQDVQSDEQMSVTCFLSFGSIVAKAVAKDQYQIPKTSEMLFSSEKRQHYVQTLEQQLENTDDELRQAALLMALGNMALEEALPVLEKYIRANNNIPKVVQVKAIYALLPLSKMFPEYVRESLVSVLFNTGENTRARIAAFNVLVASRPRRHLYEKIAAMTQYEEDTVLNTFIYSSFQALANATQPCLADASSHARHAVDFMDEQYDTSAWIGANTVFEGEMNYLDADAFLRLASIGDAGSMTPSMFYIQLNNLVGNSAAKVFSLAMNGNNTSYLVETMIGAQAIFEDRSWAESIKVLNKPLKNLGLKDLAEEVGYVPRKQPQFSALISTRIMEFQQRLRRVDKESLVNMIRSAKGKEDLRFKFDVQTTRMPVDVSYFMQLDSGYLFQVNAKTPIHMSLKGEIEISPKASAKHLNIEIDAKIKVNIAARAIIRSSILLPENGLTSVGTGYETTVVAAPLIAGKINIQLQQQKLSIKCKATDVSTSGTETEIVRYHTQPFTFISQPLKLRKLSDIAKTIHNEKKPSRSQVPIIGNSLILKLQDEQYWDGRPSIFKYFEENSLLGIAVNGWMAHQWTPRRYSLIWTKSQLPELTYQMEWEYKPAPGDPQQHIDGFGYVLWREVFGVADVPMRCQNGQRGPYDSHSESKESSRSTSDQLSSESNEWPSSERPRSSLFKHSTDSQGRWAGWASSKSDSSSSEETTTESAQPRWAMGWMSQGDEDKSESSSEHNYHTDRRHRHSRDDSSSKSRESRRSSEEDSRRGRGTWKSDAPSTGRLNIQQADITEGVAVYTVRAEAKVKSDVEKGITINLVVKKPRKEPQTIVDILVKTQGSIERKMVCLKVKYEGERVPCRIGNSQPNLSNANITMNASLTWGQQCDQPEGFVDISMKARKSREQLKMQQSDKPYFFDQCKEDKQNGNEYSYACMEKLLYQSRLNFVSAIVKYDKISKEIQNITEKLQDFAIYKFYPHLSHDALARNPSNQITVNCNFHPNIPVVDVKIQHPQQTLHFKKIFYGEVEPFIGPPSIARSLVRRVVNYYADGDLTPTCSVTDQYINNFHNDTIEFSGRDTCQYLVTGDCSPSNLFYVLLQNNSKSRNDNSKTLTVQLLQNVVQINPQARQVLINNKQVEMKENSIAFLKDETYGPTLLGYVVKADGLYKVVLPFNRISVVFDGENVGIRTSNLWRNKLCGICGEYNPEDNEPFTGPKQCQYSVPNDFAQAYALRSKDCPRHRQEGDKQCDLAEPSFRHIPSQGSCSIQKPIIKVFGNGQKVCGSDRPYKACRPGCIASESRTIDVSLKCVSKGNEGYQDLKEGRQDWYEIAQHKADDVSATVEVPINCVPR